MAGRCGGLARALAKEPKTGRHWPERAPALKDRPDAYLFPDADITRAAAGPVGLAHGPAGAAPVHVLIAGAAGDPAGMREGVAVVLSAADAGGVRRPAPQCGFEDPGFP
ncbi:MAG: hypothetical protein NZM27_03010 [Acetobacteraceae bacterium]|nr:hypothetical protein [Acetobacteraceae bacterium]MDW8397042.1 hypothetical protein [Acetobacteraceae bacterium]